MHGILHPGHTGIFVLGARESRSIVVELHAEIDNSSLLYRRTIEHKRKFDRLLVAAKTGGLETVVLGHLSDSARCQS